MSKRRKKIDNRQMQLPLGHDNTVKKCYEEFIEKSRSLEEIISAGPRQQLSEDEYECCNEIAGAIKADLRKTGLSREQVVDYINQFFSRSKQGANADPQTCRKPLTLNMFNNYLSKPREYPIPAYYLFAIQHITNSFEAVNAIVAAKGARVIPGPDIREIALLRLNETRKEGDRLAKMLQRGQWA